MVGSECCINTDPISQGQSYHLCWRWICPCLLGAADYIKGSMCSNSSCSLNSENPYATIRDPPGLACKHTESSYVEMKSPSHREVPFGGTATLLGSASRNVYDVGECVVALVRGAQQGPVAYVVSGRAPPVWTYTGGVSLDESKYKPPCCMLLFLSPPFPPACVCNSPALAFLTYPSVLPFVPN